MTPNERAAMVAEAKERDKPHRRLRDMDHLFHVWINQRQDERRNAGESWEHDLYEWKDALREMQRLPHWLRQARTGTLPTIHTQCSHSEPEPITANRLRCALGVDVTECPILRSLYASFEAERTHIAAYSGEPSYPNLTADDGDEIAARVCTWHIFTEQMRLSFEERAQIDTSEGYVQDEGDRMFWRNVYDNLSRGMEEPE
jgi:hypothetical protein